MDEVKGTGDWGLGIGVVVYQTKNYVRGFNPVPFLGHFPQQPSAVPKLKHWHSSPTNACTYGGGLRGLTS
ncbi:hypothetical protein NIES4073_10300 [Kalymmatonema gypsitolerans NIES-4073]|nr:hypothetical protein NIES4073_10300 [Scytonema sp. NIES-4073]